MRDIIVGKNSAIWRELSGRPDVAARFPVALGHADLEGQHFGSDDRLWILSYSRHAAENERLLHGLKAAGATTVIYVSSATTVVAERTSCYSYPAAKLAAEQVATSILDAVILTIGVVYRTISDLPAGTTMATSYDDLAAFLLAPRLDQRKVRLFTPTTIAFRSATERRLHTLYSAVISRLGRWPCLLRPIDLALKTLGYRWYGYVNLSNTIWLTTIS